MHKDITIDAFEDTVRCTLERAGFDLSAKSAVAAAVSGGADSISLLTALHHLLPENIKLMALTVNHNIRPAAETEGDAAFVEDYCSRLGVECFRFDIPRGKVAVTAQERGMGVEEAARALRYQIFESFAEERGLSALFSAHNRNDQTETVLMRFLSGGDSGALEGIPLRRGIYIRPLLELERSQIESYLEQQGLSWRTDLTNFDNSMFRNKIRNVIIPFLDQQKEGWRQAVNTLSQKMAADNNTLEKLTDNAQNLLSWRETGSEEKEVSFLSKEYSAQEAAVQRRLFYRALETVGARERVPYSLFERISADIQSRKALWSENASGIKVFQDRSYDGDLRFFKDNFRVYARKRKLAYRRNVFPKRYFLNYAAVIKRPVGDMRVFYARNIYFF